VTAKSEYEEQKMNEMSLVSTWHSDDVKVQKAFYGVPSTHASISHSIKSQ
jgi:hypothetical protein